MPDLMLKPDDPRIRDMKVGDVAFAPISALEVIADRTVWLRPGSVCQSKRDFVFSLKIICAAEGFRVVSTGKWQWVPTADTAPTKGYLPVIEIAQELDTEGL